MNRSFSLPFLIMGVVFCVCLICSNLLEVKMISLGGITATAGLIVFPISYIINDCIAEVWGYRKARLIIWLGFLMNLMAVIFIQIAIILPSAPFWDGQKSFETVKTAYEIVILPVTIRVVRFVKKIDGSDVYDQKVSYNIFKIKELQ